VVADDSPAGLLDKLRGAGFDRDAFLLGGQRTLNAFLELGAVDRLELLVFPEPRRFLDVRHLGVLSSARGGSKRSVVPR
jgi:hypothetical protein